MIIKNIANEIQETLKARERALGRKNYTTPGDATQSADWWKSIDITDMASRTTFVRMISNKKEPVIIAGGELGEEGTPFGFNQNVQKGDALYWDYTNEGIKPKPGIKDISVQYKGGYKAIREATINWSVNSLSDLDRLTAHFLTVGKTVLLEWGWVTKKNANKLRSFYKDGVVSPEVFTNPMKLIIDNKGDYDAMAGTVTNFEYTLNDSGGFDCVTTMVSTGINLFEGQKADSDGADVKISPAKDEKQLSNDGLVNAIINLERIILHDYCGVPYNEDGFSNFTWSIWSDAQQESQGKNVLQHFVTSGFGVVSSAFAVRKLDSDLGKEEVRTNIQGDNVSTAGALDQDGNPIVISNEDLDKITDEGATTLNSDIYLTASRFQNNSEIWIDSQDIFVRWGWFEDNILSRYISYSSGKGEEIINSFRSLETVFDEKGKPTDAKTPVLIRNHKDYLLPKNPIRFFLPGQNIKYETVDFGVRSKINEDEGVTGAPGPYLKLLLNCNNKLPFRDITDPNGKFGILRNVMINVKEIKKAFGIQSDKAIGSNNSSIFHSDVVNPPSTVKAGMKRLLSQLNENFFNFWNFEIVTDTHSNNVKIIDTNCTAHLDRGNEKLYSKFEKNSSDQETATIKSKGIYKFPSFKMGSIVQTQNLSFKIPDSMAVTAMYGSNKDKSSGIVLDTSNENSILETVFANDVGEEYFDEKLKNLSRAFLLQSGGHNIGSKSYTNPVSFDGSFDINSDEKWWSSWTTSPPETEEDVNKKTKSHKSGGEVPSLSDFSWQLKMVSGATNETGVREEIRKKQADYKKVNKELNDYLAAAGKGGVLAENETPELRDIRSRRRALKEYADIDPDKKIGKYYTFKASDDGDSGYELSLFTAGEAVIKSKLFSYEKDRATYQANFIIPAELGLTVDGIGGLTPGDIVQTDYIQAKYNAPIKDSDGKSRGPFTFFQIFNVSQKVNSDGWFTELTTKMRVNNDVLQLSAGDIITSIRSLDEKPTSEAPEGITQIPGQNDTVLTGSGVYTTPDGKTQAFGNFQPGYGLSQGRALGVPLDRYSNTYSNRSLSTYNTLISQNEFYLQDPGTRPKRKEVSVFDPADISDDLDAIDSDFDIEAILFEQEIELGEIELDRMLYEDFDFDEPPPSKDMPKIDTSPKVANVNDLLGNRNPPPVKKKTDPMVALKERLELLPKSKKPQIITTASKPISVSYGDIVFRHRDEDNQIQPGLKRMRPATMGYKVGRDDKTNWHTTFSGYIEATLDSQMGFGTRKRVKLDVEYGPYWEKYDKSSPYYKEVDGVRKDLRGNEIKARAQKAVKRTLSTAIRSKISSGEITKHQAGEPPQDLT